MKTENFQHFLIQFQFFFSNFPISKKEPAALFLIFAKLQFIGEIDDICQP